MKKQKSKPQKMPIIKKKKLKSLPNKPIRMGGGFFVGNSTT